MMIRLLAISLCVGFALLAFALLVRAVHSEEKITAPEFPDGLIWINSEAMTIKGLHGKIILVDIWDYTCINCIRTLPYISEWHERYAKYGLVIIGVHTPEFVFERDPANVTKAVNKFDIKYPVVLDNDYKIWNLYANRYWPRKYLIDQNGQIVYDHTGEGNYRETELAIQKLIKEIDPAIKLPTPYEAPGTIESGNVCYPITPELYVGYERGSLGNKEGYKPNDVVDYKDSGEYTDGYVYANGPWFNGVESLSHIKPDPGYNDYIAIKYHAMSVNAVIKSRKELPYRVYVKQDNEYVPKEGWGIDMKIDDQKRTYIEITDGRMYRIIENKEFGNHILKLYSDSDSFDIHVFTFGSCEIR